MSLWLLTDALCPFCSDLTCVRQVEASNVSIDNHTARIRMSITDTPRTPSPIKDRQDIVPQSPPYKPQIRASLGSPYSLLQRLEVAQLERRLRFVASVTRASGADLDALGSDVVEARWEYLLGR